MSDNTLPEGDDWDFIELAIEDSANITASYRKGLLGRLQYLPGFVAAAIDVAVEAHRNCWTPLQGAHVRGHDASPNDLNAALDKLVDIWLKTEQ